MPTLARVICLGLLLAHSGQQQALAVTNAAIPVALVPAAAVLDTDPAQPFKPVSFESERASLDAHQIADWIVDSGDNHKLPFVIVDKKDARVFVFYADGRLRGAASALLGLAVGDDSVPGIGNRKLSSIRPDERTTPAGRFVAATDRNLHGGEILWVDYDAAISLHPVITSNPKEHRAERLASPNLLDKRISYGCINVPAEFFKRVVSPAFTGTNGVVYILPETRPLEKVFASYDVMKRARLQTAGQGLSAPATSSGDSTISGR